MDELSTNSTKPAPKTFYERRKSIIATRIQDFTEFEGLDAIPVFISVNM